ncbi:hypothetical protein [Streptomyces atroolivaceus]|uniref:hypothetical protein n=1 Tax=Streptomyces atroolivaceus TaxID=66869 RepID=UPI002025B2F5|nr:hypothetical protein [Streptomyces atroolivaceus]
MRGWDAKGQLWQPAPAPDTGQPYAVERGLRIAAVALAVAVVGTVAFGGGRLLFRDDEVQGVEASAEATPGGTVEGGTAPGDPGSEEGASGSESPTAEEPPPGYVVEEDAEGFSVQVREGWQRREEQRDEGVVVYYETDGGEGFLQVYRISEPGYTPYDALAETDRLVGEVEGYQRLRLDDLAPADGSQAAELEYLVPRENGVVRQSLLRAFVAEDGVRWVILVAGPQDEWDGTYAEPASVAADSFCPQGYCPATP